MPKSESTESQQNIASLFSDFKIKTKTFKIKVFKVKHKNICVLKEGQNSQITKNIWKGRPSEPC